MRLCIYEKYNIYNIYKYYNFIPNREIPKGNLKKQKRFNLIIISVIKL